jgi:thiol-disulfide isomerase/thioredoxin
VNWFCRWFKRPSARLSDRAKGLRLRAIALQILLCVVLSCLLTGPAQAALNDDHYDGNIFPLYAGNGSLVPPRVRLSESRQRERAALLFFYLDDSSDCKQFVPVISQLDSFYGRAADFIPISVDMLPAKSSYEPTEAGYYYKGLVPQLVVLNQKGEVAFDQSGATMTYEQIDDALREVFDLLPRTESVDLKRRVVNEINTELRQ